MEDALVDLAAAGDVAQHQQRRARLERGGDRLDDDLAQRQRQSELGAIGGVLERAPELMVFYAPTVNSYRRTNSGEFSGNGLSWGFDSRMVSCRVLVESPEDVDALSFPEGTRLAYVTQTTLSVDETSEIITALRRRYPDIYAPKKEDICYATSNRQWAVKELVDAVDLLLVIGSRNSSNSVRLVDVARAAGVPAHLVDDVREIEHLVEFRRREDHRGSLAGGFSGLAIGHQPRHRQPPVIPASKKEAAEAASSSW